VHLGIAISPQSILVIRVRTLGRYSFHLQRLYILAAVIVAEILVDSEKLFSW
jgi:hypothetical protein